MTTFHNPIGSLSSFSNSSTTVVQEIFACKIFRLLIFCLLYFLSHKPNEKCLTVTIIRCIKYFACLIFVGRAHQWKSFNGENFSNYGIKDADEAVRNATCTWLNSRGGGVEMNIGLGKVCSDGHNHHKVTVCVCLRVTVTCRHVHAQNWNT